MGIGLGMITSVGGTVGNMVGGAVNNAFAGITEQQTSTPLQAAEMATAFCENCGAALAPDSAFCEKCGTPMPKDNSKCANCGYVFERPGKFCPKCGTKREG